MKLSKKELARRLQAVKDTQGIWKDLPKSGVEALSKEINDEIDRERGAEVLQEMKERRHDC